MQSRRPFDLFMCSSRQVLQGILDNRLPDNAFYKERQWTCFLFHWSLPDFLWLCITRILLATLLRSVSSLKYVLSKHFLLCATKLFLLLRCPVFIETINKESVFLLHNSLHLITAPVLIIWGKEDQVKIKRKLTRTYPIYIFNLFRAECIHADL